MLQQMYEKMQDLYRHISKFYVFDMKKYTLDEFFGDIKAFKEKFYVSFYHFVEESSLLASMKTRLLFLWDSLSNLYIAFRALAVLNCFGVWPVVLYTAGLLLSVYYYSHLQCTHCISYSWDGRLFYTWLI